MKKILLLTILFLNMYLLVQIATFTATLKLRQLTNIILKIILKNVNKSLCILNNFEPSNYSLLTIKNDLLISLHTTKFTLETVIED